MSMMSMLGYSIYDVFKMYSTVLISQVRDISKVLIGNVGWFKCDRKWSNIK